MLDNNLWKENKSLYIYIYVICKSTLCIYDIHAYVSHVGWNRISQGNYKQFGTKETTAGIRVEIGSVPGIGRTFRGKSNGGNEYTGNISTCK